MPCRNCQCNDCKILSAHEKLHTQYAKRDADNTRRLWNISLPDEHGSITQYCLDQLAKELYAIKHINVYPLHAEDFWGLPKIPDVKIEQAPQDDYVCQRCGCDKLCTQTDRTCWKCGEPVKA